MPTDKSSFEALWARREERLCPSYKFSNFRSVAIARLRTRQFVRGPPACDPRFDIVQRNGEPRPFEFVVATAILGDIRTIRGIVG